MLLKRNQNRNDFKINSTGPSDQTWQEQLRFAIKCSSELERFLGVPVPRVTYPIMIPRALAQMIKQGGPHSGLWKQFVPQIDEELDWGLTDPIGDHQHQVAPQLIHRYNNRVLFLPTKICPVACRYCFRKTELSTQDELFEPQFESTIKYLKKNSQIHEIIFSGGDPLVLSNNKLKKYFEVFSTISHISFLRIHTRMPVILADRIDNELLHILHQYQVKIVVHINHPDELELSLSNQHALKKLATVCTVLSQTVLLYGINNCTDILEALILNLLKLNVRPYYLHHPDQAKGTKHFQLSIEDGKKIMTDLRKRLPGWALFQYILDDPSGCGKKIIN